MSCVSGRELKTWSVGASCCGIFVEICVNSVLKMALCLWFLSPYFTGSIFFCVLNMWQCVLGDALDFFGLNQRWISLYSSKHLCGWTYQVQRDVVSLACEICGGSSNLIPASVMKVFGAWSLLKSKSLVILPVLLCIRHHLHFPVSWISARRDKYQGVLANADCCKVLLHKKHTFMHIENWELTCTLQMLIMTLSSFPVVIYGRGSL